MTNEHSLAGRQANDATQPSSAPAKSPKEKAVRPSKWKRWCFRLLAVGLSLAVVALVEASLLLFGVGRDLGLIVAVEGNPQALRYQFNPEADRPYFGKHDVAGPEPRRFDLPQPEGVLRIVVVGGSTVLGFPYPPELAFPRQMEVLLEQQNPAEEFEVLNAGMVSINSFSVADVVAQVVSTRPDLIIVHTGHNEFYGPGGAASTAIVAPPPLYPSTVELRRTRLYQLAAACFQGESQPQSHLLESLPRSVQVPFQGPDFRRAERDYRANLTRIAQTADRAKVPLVLTTVAANVGNHSPVSFLVPTELDAERLEQWKEHFDAARQLAAQESWTQALARCEQASDISRDSSLLNYRLGQCLRALDRIPESRAAFQRARDLDGCRLRAPGSFRCIVHDVATRFERRDVYLVDVAQALETDAPVPDEDLFLEHVHYTLDGHRQVASMLARFVQTNVLLRKWNSANEPGNDQLDELLGNLPEDRISGLSAALRVMNVFPMTETFDAALHQQALVAQIQAAYSELGELPRETFTDLSLDDMSLQLPAALADRYRGAGRHDRELFYRRCDLLRRPWNAESCFQLARCLAEVDAERPQALAHCRRAMELSPRHAEARRLMSELQSNAGHRQPSTE